MVVATILSRQLTRLLVPNPPLRITIGILLTFYRPGSTNPRILLLLTIISLVNFTVIRCLAPLRRRGRN